MQCLITVIIHAVRHQLRATLFVSYVECRHFKNREFIFNINFRCFHCVFSAFPLTCVFLSLLPTHLDEQKVGWNHIVSLYFIHSCYLPDISWTHCVTHPAGWPFLMFLWRSHTVPQITDHLGWIVSRTAHLWDYDCNLKIPRQNVTSFS